MKIGDVVTTGDRSSGWWIVKRLFRDCPNLVEISCRDQPKCTAFVNKDSLRKIPASKVKKQ